MNSLSTLKCRCLTNTTGQNVPSATQRRSFDQLNSGEEYKEVLPVHSIGFLNFTLFEDQPEFFATYELRNKKTGHLYSSKFSIHVLDLTRIDLATAEDQNYEIDRWAKLFKAKTWEELRMIAKNNPDLLQASNDLYTVNADEIIRQRGESTCRCGVLGAK